MLSILKSYIALHMTLLYPLYWATIRKLHLKTKKEKHTRSKQLQMRSK